MPKPGRYYPLSTLGCSRPDAERRTIYRWPDLEPVLVFNAELRPWTEADERHLQQVVNALNKAREDAIEECAAVFDDRAAGYLMPDTDNETWLAVAQNTVDGFSEDAAALRKLKLFTIGQDKP